VLIQEHMRQIVKACRPATREEWIELWSDIQPVKFGATVNWLAAAQYTLALYQVPRERFNIVLRVECYTVNLTSGAADYGSYEPPPPGTAFWEYVPYGTGTVYVRTDENSPVQLLLDCDEYIIAQGGYNTALIGDFAVSPDGATRAVRTLCYSYNVGPRIVDLIGAGEMLVAPV
jgi:hypothetical protein